MDLIFKPMIMRALFGEKLEVLRAEIARVDRLREFWTRVTTDGAWSGAGNDCVGLAPGDAMRRLLNQMSAGFAAPVRAAAPTALRPTNRPTH